MLNVVTEQKFNRDKSFFPHETMAPYSMKLYMNNNNHHVFMRALIL